jgi:hypothetical protein
MSTLKRVSTIAMAGMMILMTSSAIADGRTKGRGASGAEIYVTSQNLFYDTILLGDLPYNGTENFQLLVLDDAGPYTEFGPRDAGYYGGRWWVDVNENGEMDEGDKFFLCPLLGPGREPL